MLTRWQSIETAPKEREVLVFAPSERPPIFSSTNWAGRSGWSRTSGGISAEVDSYFGDPPFTPTHWMPLPEPPLRA